ncbi:MAG TPA: EamA family transporter RarD [Opitutus sp.]|nr:EamA family transporter RarD [Opitutus sp.]
MLAKPNPSAVRGAFAAAGAYLAWGLFPLYWKQLSSVNAVEVIAHRHLWSLGFVMLAMLVGGTMSELKAALVSARALAVHTASGVLLTINWLVFIWGVNAGYVLEASLGYFLVPLVNVALGRFVLHERLRWLQWTAIALAAAGVVLLLIRVGRLPWIALSLAGTFGAYGLLRKKSPLGALTGLGLETLLVAPLAVGFLTWRQLAGTGALGQASVGVHALLIGAGVVTAVPLVSFAFGARRIRFTTLGLLQYIAPTAQFAIGVWVYREPFSSERAAAFGFIWAGLVLYTIDNLWAQRRLKVS